MRRVSCAGEMQKLALQLRREGKCLGLVPTMGALHAGHLSLVQRAVTQCDVVVVSIFVNPLQFGPSEDLDAYPRDLEGDAAKCAAAGADIVFSPELSAMYKPDRSVSVTESDLSRGLCGASRPGHFDGVTTVVAKLFHIALPDVAVFGQKDAQQVAVIKRMVRDLDFPVRIDVAPIVREPDGVAMSSRNAYLSPEERRQARCLSRGLAAARSLYAEGAGDPEALRAAIVREIGKSPLATIDYVALVDEQTLRPVEHSSDSTLIALAVRVGPARLIDNCVLGREM